MRMQRVTYFAGGLPGTVLSIGSAIAFFYGGMRVIDGSLTLGTMGAFLAYQMRVFAPAQALMGLYASLATAKVSWSRVLEILDAPIDVVEAPDAEAIATPSGELTLRRGVAGDRSPVARARRSVVHGAARTDRGARRRQRRRQVDDRLSRDAVARSGRRRRSPRRPRSARRCSSRASAGTSSSSSRSRRCCTRRSRRTSATCGRRATTDDVRKAAEAAGIARFHPGPCRRDTRRWSASAAWRCRPASGSASRWRAPFWPIRRCSSWTSRPRRSMRSRSARSSKARAR